MPEAKTWSPDAPNLYRCRVTAQGFRRRGRAVRLPQFPPRSAGGKLPEAMFLLNGQPVFLRGTNIQGFNAYWYWGQTDQLLDALLLLKAGNFNTVRSCQHVEFSEVREQMDRLGIMSKQDQGGGYRGR